MIKSFNINKYYKFLMYLVVVVLINIASTTLFFRIDLTSDNIFSLSSASKQVVGTLSEPLTVKVFFTGNLPAPYNNIERYIHDLLQEYSIAGNRYFNYQFYNVSSDENEKTRQNQQLARNYGIFPVQIQNIEEDEVKFQKAYMGMVLIHGDIIETIPTITSTDGLEFKITSTIRQLNNKISALLGLEDEINIKLFLSSSLQIVGPYMNLTGLSELPRTIERLVEKLNERNYDKLSFVHLDPSQRQSDEEEVNRYNVLALQWDQFKDRQGKMIPANKGYAGIIVEHRSRAEEIQLLKVVRLPLFGTQYILSDAHELEKNISETVENIINVNEEIGYLADHGTHALKTGTALPGQSETGSLSNFHNLLSAEYSITPVNLKEENIPEALPTLIIAGATQTFSEYELYQIDQYLMKGRNLVIFMDAFNEVMVQQDQLRMMMGQQQASTYLPLDTGLEKLLAHYGLQVKKSYILDKNCFKQQIPRAFGGGERDIYFAPIIKNEHINKNVTFLKNIKGLVMLKSSPVEADEEKIKDFGLKPQKLFSSSRESWEMSGRINLNPLFIQPPQAEEEYKEMAIAYMLEGSFPSYFADKSIPVKENKDDETQPKEQEKGVDMSHIRSPDMTIKKGKPGKIFLIGTSEILKDNVIDEEGISPNAHFIMNVIDALNNREDYASMRSKTQRFNPLKDIGAGTKTIVKTVNIVGLPFLVIFAGVLIWLRRLSRQKIIQQMFKK